MSTPKKKNSLKLVPYTKHVVNESEYDETLRVGYGQPGFQQYLDSRKVITVFDGEILLDYTQGKPGEQLRDGWGANGNTIDWRPNEPFTATIRLHSLERGRSATRFWYVDETNKVMYPFFGDTVVETLKELDSFKGEITGTWIVVRKGSNYGIELYQP